MFLICDIPLVALAVIAITGVPLLTKDRISPKEA